LTSPEAVAFVTGPVRDCWNSDRVVSFYWKSRVIPLASTLRPLKDLDRRYFKNLIETSSFREFAKRRAGPHRGFAAAATAFVVCIGREDEEPGAASWAQDSYVLSIAPDEALKARSAATEPA
jgi:hypothetical protein